MKNLQFSLDRIKEQIEAEKAAGNESSASGVLSKRLGSMTGSSEEGSGDSTPVPGADSIAGKASNAAGRAATKALAANGSSEEPEKTEDSEEGSTGSDDSESEEDSEEEGAGSSPQEDEDTRPAKEPVHEAAPAGSSPILAERIRPAGGLRHALSLNDSFHFARELFGGDTSALNALLARMDDAHCLEEASLLFVQAIHVPEDNPAVPEFEELLKKYFEP